MNVSLKRIGHPDQELALYDSAFNLGSGDEDDVQFQEEGVVASHVRFIAIDNMVILQGAKGAVYINGKPLGVFPHTWAEGEVLSLSSEVHLYLGTIDTVEPTVPTLQVVVKGDQKPMDLFKNLPQFNWKPVAGVVAIMAAALVGLNLISSNEVVVSQTYEKPPMTKVSSTVAEGYFRQILGANLLAYEEDDDSITLRILSDDIELMKRWTEDIDRLLPKIDKEVYIELVDPQDIVMKAKMKLQAVVANQPIEIDGLTVKLKGACLPDQCARIREAMETVKVANVKIVNQVHEIKTAPVRILSVTISEKNAQATIERGGQVMVVSERGRVFDIGTLRLIRQDGLEINTGHGTVFMPWVRS